MKQKLMAKILLLVVFCAVNAYPALADGVSGNKYFVDGKHPNASDNNPGTKEKPWKTVVFAVKTLKAGDKVIVNPGTYYGTLKFANAGEEGKPIVVEGSSLGDVVITGEKAVKDWKRCENDSRLWEAGYDLKLYKVYPSASCSSQYKYYVNSEPADLMMDGMPLFWSYDGKFLPGTWKVDKEAKKIYARLPDDGNPNEHFMGIISQDHGFNLSPAKRGKSCEHIVVRNLVVRRFGTGFRIYGKHILLENNIIEWCAYDGLQFGSRSRFVTQKNNTFRWNGKRGTRLGAKAVCVDNRFLFNNWKLNSAGWDAAGLKAGAHGLEGTISGNEAAYNGALGIWLDVYLNNVIVKDNIVHDNAHVGLETEMSDKTKWEGNLSYRNKAGFALSSSSNVLIKGNVFLDNFCGIKYVFRRTRVPNEFSQPKRMKRLLEIYRDNYSKEKAYDWIMNLYTFHSPCCLFKNNLTENNLLLNNGMNFDNAPPKQLTDPKEAWMISGNVFKNNILVNSKPDKMIAGYSSLAQYQEKTKDAKKCLSFSKLDISKLPDWAKKIYEKHSDKLSYPRSYLSVKKIYNALSVRNGAWCGYNGLPAPAGLFALAQICESEKLKEKKFPDKFLKAYFITYKNKPTLVIWRRHGHPADFVPVLLKGLSKDANVETAWGKSLPIERKNDITSINVGTWPLFIMGVDENITEVKPFALRIPKTLEYGKPMEIAIDNPLGEGTLFIDKLQGVKNCPSEVNVKGDKIVFPLTLMEDAKGGFVRFRIAGHLDGLYAGQMVRLFTGKLKGGAEGFLRDKGFTPVPLDSVANCSLDGDSAEKSLLQMGVSQSLKKLPETIKLGKIPFSIAKGSKSCLGLNTIRTKGEARPDVVTIDLGGKKIKALAFLQVCAWAPKKVGAPLLKYNLNYDDNFSESTFVKNGVNVLDWWKPMDESQKMILKGNSSWLAWSGDCGNSHHVSLYAYVWKNPKPEAGVLSLQISVADPDKKALMGVIAISVLENKKK